MYTGHFGLDDGPFHGKAEGQDVYIGAPQAAVVARLRKVLAIGDTAVTVTGPVGVGKSTLVRRALTELAGRKTIIPVERMRLEPDEVLELLLSRFDVSRQPKGTIQRVSAFRRLLHERIASDTRVFIVVEDAERIGVDALLEIEALTATDSGESVGANIVLMGTGELPGLLAQPALARLRQRIRLRQTVAPFDEADVEGYMRHCLESAGGVLEQIFEPGIAHIVYRYSGGVARVVDNLCESALVAAAEAGLTTILPEFLQEVAENCGLEGLPEPDHGAEVPASVQEEDPIHDAAEDLSLSTPSPLVTPPRLALVERLPPTADAGTPEAAERLSDDLATEPAIDAALQADGDPPDDAGSTHTPVADVAGSDPGEACGVGQHLDERKSHESHPMMSRIDEVLPELLERLQSHAEGGTQIPADPGQPDNDSFEDSVEIPTLSNSMRVAVLPLRPMKERPRTAEDIDDDERPVNNQGPVSVDACPLPDESASPGLSPDDDTGIAPVLPESVQETELPADAKAGPVVKAAEDDVETELPADEAAVADPLPGDSPTKEMLTAGAAAVEAEAKPEIVAEQEQVTEPPQAAAQERSAELEPTGRGIEASEILSGMPVDGEPSVAEAPVDSTAEANAIDEAANDAESSEKESADLERLLAAEYERMPDAETGIGASEDEATTEAVALSFDGELTLAPDTPAEQCIAEENGCKAGHGESGLDALEAAIEAANAWEASETGADLGPVVPQSERAAEPGLPEITLDTQLEKGKPEASDLDRWADELSKAKSLEDISDILAETIFGNEAIEAISAEIRANREAERPREAGAATTAAPREPDPAKPKGPVSRPSATDKAPHAPAVPAGPKTPARPAAGNGVNMTLSQRIEMVKSLKGPRPVRPAPGMPIAEIVLAEQPDEPVAPANGPQPIEAQIDTAITQSRKVLSEADLARLAASGNDNDNDDDKGKRGLFGFFRRSSKS